MLPARYSAPTFQSRIHFLTECAFTVDDAGGGRVISAIPALPGVVELAWSWGYTFDRGLPLIVDKSRRVIASWTCRALELREALIRPSTFYMACQDFEDSAKMVKRYEQLYENLRARFVDWGLAAGKAIQFRGEDMLSQYRLPNGSRFVSLTGGNPNSFRQEGATGVILEEGAFFPRLAKCWSNAIAMCTGRGGKNGHPVLISTTNPESGEWSRIRKVARVAERVD